jgi:hypothetical protein
MKTGTTTIIAHPSTSEQLETLRAFFTALKIKFEVQTDEAQPYERTFVDKVLQGDKDFENGDFKIIKTEDLWK